MIQNFRNFRVSEQQTKEQRPRNFDEYLEESIKEEGLNRENKYVASMNNWLKLKESKAENVIDKIPVDELPNCEQIDVNNSKIGDFISKEQFEELYDDEKGELLGGLKNEGDILAFCFNDNTTWWKRRIDDKEGGDGLVRIK